FADLILSMLRPQPSAPLFPYTTLFRSRHCTVGVAGAPIKAPARGPSALLRAQELARIGHPAVLPDLEVDVGAGAAAGAAGPGDLLAHADQVADLDGVAGVVGVAGHVAVAVVDLDHVAGARADAGVAHHAVGHGHDRVAGAGVEVDALVPGGAAAEGIGAAAEAGGDVAGRHRRARGHGVAVQLAVEQQHLEHGELAAGGVQLHVDAGDALAQLAGRHVADRA